MSDYISDDLFSLILRFLPVRHLLRCRTVRKSWKAIVDSRSFIHDHAAVQTPRLIANLCNSIDYSCFFVLDYKTLNFPPIGYQKMHELPVVAQDRSQINDLANPPICISGIVDGVLCLYDNENLLLLWNPSIHRFLILPCPPIRPIADLLNLLPSDFKCCGFWIDPRDLSFKVVIIFAAQAKLAVYSSVNQSWMESGIESKSGLDEEMIWSGDAQILIQGVAYWKLGKSSSDHRIIVSFDFVQERLGTIEFPKVKQVENVVYKINVIKWRDCVSFVHWQKMASPCDLWALQNGRWTKMFSFNIDQCIAHVLHVADDLGSILAESKGGSMLSYDLKDARLKGEFRLPEGVIRAPGFVESLVFPC